MTCPICSRPVVWAHLSGWPKAFEQSEQGPMIILNGVAHCLWHLNNSDARMWNGPRYDYHECKETKDA